MATKKNEEKKKPKRGNHEGSITLRKDGRWHGRIEYNGKIQNFYSKTGGKKQEVVDKLNSYKVMMNSPDSNKEKFDMPIDEYIGHWLANVQSNKLKPTSYDRLECTINNHVIPKIGYHTLRELTSRQIQEELINEMFKPKNPNAKPSSRSSIKKAYDAINALYKYAITVRQIDYNPCNAVEIPAVHKFDKKEIRWFNDDEIKEFKETCLLKYSNGSYVFPLGYGFIFMMNTGIRLGEALALKWTNIDFEKKEAHIITNMVMAVDRKTEDKKRVQINQEFLKTKHSNRIIPLNSTAINALNEIKNIRFFGDDSFILCTADGTQNKVRNFCRTFESIIKRTKLKDCGVHTLRHTFASSLFRKNCDVKTVSQLLGHSDVGVTYNTYLHIIKEQKIAAINSIDEI